MIQEVPKDKVKNLTFDPDYQRIVANIDAQVDYVNIKQYSHNIISVCLREAANKFGTAAANDLIEEFELEKLGWVKVKDENII